MKNQEVAGVEAEKEEIERIEDLPSAIVAVLVIVIIIEDLMKNLGNQTISRDHRRN